MSEFEEWKVIPGYSKYLVSNLGNVKRLDGFPMKQRLDRQGYWRVGIQKDGSKHYQRLVHGLVLLAFVGPRPEKYCGAHLDGDKKNAKLSNLAYVTRKENEAHKEAHGTLMFGEKHYKAKVTQEAVDYIRANYVKGPRGHSNAAELAEKFGFKRNYIAQIASGYVWRKSLDQALNRNPDDGEK